MATVCELDGSGLPRSGKGNTSEDDGILIRTSSDHLKMTLEIEPDVIWPVRLKLKISARPDL